MNPNRYSKASSPSQRSLTPTMLIESPQYTLANYKMMLKKAKTKPKVTQSSGLSSTLSFKQIPSVLESISSTDTCIFPSPIKPDQSEVENLRNQLEELHLFTRQALDSQKKYFEEIIFGLEEEIHNDKESFNKEICLLKQEICILKEAKEEKDSFDGTVEYNNQYQRNREFIDMLEKQNKLLYEKMRKNKL